MEGKCGVDGGCVDGECGERGLRCEGVLGWVCGADGRVGVKEGNERGMGRMGRMRGGRCGWAAVLAVVLAAGMPREAEAQEVRDSVKIYFRQGYSVLDESIRGNREALGRIADSLRTSYADSVYILERVQVVGGASPEGTIPLNRRLSEKRADVLFNYLSRYGALPDSLTTFTFLGRDWRGLIRLVEADPGVPYREETLEFLRDIAGRVVNGVEDAADNNVGRLSRFRGGAPYRYMYRELFPELRASRVHLWYRKVRNPMLPPLLLTAEPVALPATAPALALVPAGGELTFPRPFYMALRTNLLYDALLVPNVGLEFYLGGGWSAEGWWTYAWWKRDRRHWYWRVYGGSLTLRRWFGRRAAEKPLTGHHAGVYGQWVTYDFETGGRGQMGGEPGGDIWDRASFGAGLEYGYALPIGRRLNLDFVAGLGYLGGTYYEYEPEDDCYVWQATKKRRYVGPTKLEVTLMWLVGRGNVNKGKGGKR